MNKTTQFARPTSWRRFAAFAVVLACAAIVDAALWSSPVDAHGERNQEAFLRMRTLLWYDVNWSTDEVGVYDGKNGGELVLTGKFHVVEDWPGNITPPDDTAAFLSTGGPGSVMVKKGSYLGGQPAIFSSQVKRGRDYEFKLVMAGHHPGKYHIHPTLMVKEAGPLIGPGAWVEIKGDNSDFAFPMQAMEGTQIPNLATWQLGTVFSWHALWGVIAVLWLLWWIRRPLFIPRMQALKNGREDVLITKADILLGAVLLVGTIGIVFAGVSWANAKYPISVPLQSRIMQIEPLPLPKQTVDVKTLNASYDVPGRSLKAKLQITNNTDKPVQLGEFTSANVRFVNGSVPIAKSAVPGDYPKDVVNEGLHVSDNTPIAAGETRVVDVDATDAAWELERLTSLLNDPDNSFGALLFFYDDDGERHISVVGGPIVPRFL